MEFWELLFLNWQYFFFVMLFFHFRIKGLKAYERSPWHNCSSSEAILAFFYSRFSCQNTRKTQVQNSFKDRLPCKTYERVNFRDSSDQNVCLGKAIPKSCGTSKKVSIICWPIETHLGLLFQFWDKLLLVTTILQWEHYNRC